MTLPRRLAEIFGKFTTKTFVSAGHGDGAGSWALKDAEHIIAKYMKHGYQHSTRIDTLAPDPEGVDPTGEDEEGAWKGGRSMRDAGCPGCDFWPVAPLRRSRGGEGAAWSYARRVDRDEALGALTDLGGASWRPSGAPFVWLVSGMGPCHWGTILKKDEGPGLFALNNMCKSLCFRYRSVFTGAFLFNSLTGSLRDYHQGHDDAETLDALEMTESELVVRDILSIVPAVWGIANLLDNVGWRGALK